LNSVDEAIIFLDMDLKIRRYTPQMGQIMILLPGDVGRSISDIAMNIRYEDLMIDIRSVLDSLNTREKEVQTKEGRWFKLKILPYRTVENVIDGVVITFYDIDLQKKILEKAGPMIWLPCPVVEILSTGRHIILVSRFLLSSQ
jgi:two-component system CheB/CheR fusion protein